MLPSAIPSPSPEAVFSLWLEELQADDHARGTIRRYKSAVEGFLAWYQHEEQRPFTLAVLTLMTLVGYRNFLQNTQRRATSTVNGHLSALRAWCAWLTDMAVRALANVWVRLIFARWHQREAYQRTTFESAQRQHARRIA